MRRAACFGMDVDRIQEPEPTEPDHAKSSTQAWMNQRKSSLVPAKGRDAPEPRRGSISFRQPRSALRRIHEACLSRPEADRGCTRATSRRSKPSPVSCSGSAPATCRRRQCRMPFSKPDAKQVGCRRGPRSRGELERCHRDTGSGTGISSEMGPRRGRILRPANCNWQQLPAGRARPPSISTSRLEPVLLPGSTRSTNRVACRSPSAWTATTAAWHGAGRGYILSRDADNGRLVVAQF